MSALFLLMIPPIGLATYRVLSARGTAKLPAALGAGVVAALLTVVPAYALRTKPSHGGPLETPVGPAFAETGPGVQLLVEFGAGWGAAVEAGGQRVRQLAGRGEVVVGPLQAVRPQATLAFEATTPAPTQLVVRLEGRTLAGAGVGPRARRVAVAVPQGEGPAVLQLELASGGVLTVPLASVRATALVDD